MQHVSTLEASGLTLAPGSASSTPTNISISTSSPAASVTPVQPPMAVKPSTEPELLPVLVADDDPDDRYFITRLIKKTGVKNPVKAFDDGTELVNYLGARLAAGCMRRGTPELLFLDLRMVGLGGFGFLEWAKQQKHMPLTIVVLSNSDDPVDMQKALELGAHRYLIKYPCIQTINTIVRSVYPQTVF